MMPSGLPGWLQARERLSAAGIFSDLRTEAVDAALMLATGAINDAWKEDWALTLLAIIDFDPELVDALCINKSGMGLLHFAAKQGGVGCGAGLGRRQALLAACDSSVGHAASGSRASAWQPPHLCQMRSGATLSSAKLP